MSEYWIQVSRVRGKGNGRVRVRGRVIGSGRDKGIGGIGRVRGRRGGGGGSIGRCRGVG